MVSHELPFARSLVQEVLEYSEEGLSTVCVLSIRP